MNIPCLEAFYFHHFPILYKLLETVLFKFKGNIAYNSQKEIGGRRTHMYFLKDCNKGNKKKYPSATLNT